MVTYLASKVCFEKMCVKYLYLLSLVISVTKVLHFKGKKMNPYTCKIILNLQDAIIQDLFLSLSKLI